MAFDFFHSRSAVMNIAISDIAPNPFQPREDFSAEGLSDLSESIKQSGVIQPVSVRRSESGFELIAGERRIRAAAMAGLKTVPALIYEIGDTDSALWAILENIKRKDLSFIEEAKAIKELAALSGMNGEELAKKLSMAPSTLSNKLRILHLPKEALDLITKAGLTEHHAREILRLKTPKEQIFAASHIAKHSLNVPETERYINSLLAEKRTAAKPLYLIKDVKLFINTFEHAVEVMKQNGISAKADFEENEDSLTYKVTIPKSSAYSKKAGA